MPVHRLYDPSIQHVQDWVRFSKSATDISLEEIVGELPSQWYSLVSLPFRLPKEILGRVTSVKLSDGLLTFEGCAGPHGSQLLVDILYRGISTHSSKICMVCGRVGQRRKIEFGKPVLCTLDYINYLNFLRDTNSYE